MNGYYCSGVNNIPMKLLLLGGQIAIYKYIYIYIYIYAVEFMKCTNIYGLLFTC